MSASSPQLGNTYVRAQCLRHLARLSQFPPYGWELPGGRSAALLNPGLPAVFRFSERARPSKTCCGQLSRSSPVLALIPCWSRSSDPNENRRGDGLHMSSSALLPRRSPSGEQGTSLSLVACYPRACSFNYQPRSFRKLDQALLPHVAGHSAHLEAPSSKRRHPAKPRCIPLHRAANCQTFSRRQL